MNLLQSWLLGPGAAKGYIESGKRIALKHCDYAAIPAEQVLNGYEFSRLEPFFEEDAWKAATSAGERSCHAYVSILHHTLSITYLN